MSGVGRPHPAGPLVAVERQHVGTQRLVEKVLVERPAQGVGPPLQRLYALGMAQAPRDLGGGFPGAVDIGLNFGRRARAPREPPVFVAYRFVAVLPADW